MYLIFFNGIFALKRWYFSLLLRKIARGYLLWINQSDFKEKMVYNRDAGHFGAKKLK